MDMEQRQRCTDTDMNAALGCTNIVVRGGVCIKHGASAKVKLCSAEAEEIELEPGTGMKMNNFAVGYWA